MKRKYNLQNPRPKKPTDEKLVQGFYSVKAKFKKEIDKQINQLIKPFK
mgnify:CR=1 FL=1